MTQEITRERLQRFWEKCGFREVDYTHKTGYDILKPDGYYYGVLFPDLDLNNLFKYAVPKLNKPITIYKMIIAEFWTAKIGATIQRRDNDPAVALFLALEEALK
jgi:hypothetical protein